MATREFKVTYTQQFVSGLLEGLSYEATLTLHGNTELQRFTEFLLEAKHTPVKPCAGSSCYLVSKWSIE